MLRELIREMLLRENDGPEAHIMNFYEDLDMSLSDLKKVIDDLLEARIENVEEKMDGQNVTFTVRNGEVETFSKGLTSKRIQRPGSKIKNYESDYADRPALLDAFTRTYESLQAIADFDPQNTESLFRNGSVAIETLTMIPENANTIVYDKPVITFVKAHAYDGGEVNQEAYKKFVNDAESIKTRISMGTVPILKLNKVINSSQIAAELESDLNKLIRIAGVSDSSTMGDLIAGLVSKKMQEELGFSKPLADRASIRIGKGDKQIFSQKDAKAFGPDVWEKIKEIENGYFLESAIKPIEEILQKLAVVIFRNLDFVLASNETESGEALRDEVRRVRNAFTSGNILANPDQLEGIRSALDRIGDEKMFEKAVEGIVFRWGGKTRKLTGLFTPINKLKGFFKYGKEPARLKETRRRVKNGW